MRSSPIIMLYSKELWEIDVSSILKFQNICLELEKSFNLKVMAHFLVVRLVHMHVTHVAGAFYSESCHHFLKIATSYLI